MSLTNACLCVLLLVGASAIRPRRTDIKDKGYSDMFQGWVDVQGQGAKNDYCRYRIFFLSITRDIYIYIYIYIYILCMYLM